MASRISTTRSQQTALRISSRIKLRAIHNLTQTSIYRRRPFTRSFASGLNMSTTSLPSPPAAPWRADFKKHIESMPVPTFVLSTLHHHQPQDSDSDSATRRTASLIITPRARTCIYRGLWGTLLPNDRNPAARNPSLFESDLPVFTTDCRMEKAGDMFVPPSLPPGNDTTKKDKVDTSASGGGGPVEAVFWAADHGTQWRIRGTAWILGPDIDDDDDDSSSSRGPKRIRSLLHERMRRNTTTCTTTNSSTTDEGEDGSESSWSFTREVTAHFGNLSPGMRGTFRHPPPGRPVARSEQDPQLGLGQKIDDLDDPVARKNFRVVVIVPAEVDRADLSDPEHPRRWLYLFRGSHGGGGDGGLSDGGPMAPKMPGGEIQGEWEVVEVWP